LETNPMTFVEFVRQIIEWLQSAALFWVLALLTAGCAIAVVVSQNVVRMAAWLLFTLGGVAGIFFLLGADFVGATQLLVYVGGTLVLVVFGVMLTAQGPFISMKTSAAEWGISAAVGMLLFGVLAASLATATWKNSRETPRPQNVAQSRDTVDVGKGFAGLGVGPEHEDPTELKNQKVRTSYLLPFEIVSVHLLVVLVGAAYLARAKRRQRMTETV
jgi:NADH:ubiquinone oxidoreductase subunit 6 (subunit J)